MRPPIELRFAEWVGWYVSYPLHRITLRKPTLGNWLIGLPVFIGTMLALLLLSVTMFPLVYGIRKVRRWMKQ